MVRGRLSRLELFSKFVSISESTSSKMRLFVSSWGMSEDSVLLRFLEELINCSVFGGSGARFTLNEGSLGSEARNPRSMLCDLSKGLGPIVEAAVPEFDGRPTVAGGVWHICRFLAVVAVVGEAV